MDVCKRENFDKNSFKNENNLSFPLNSRHDIAAQSSRVVPFVTGR